MSVLIALAGWRFYETPTGFIPAQDQGYLIGVIQMPPGSSLQRTDAVLRQAQQIALTDSRHARDRRLCRTRRRDLHHRAQCRRRCSSR